MLTVAAVISLALGLFQDFGTQRPDGAPKVDWVEGVAIMVAILIVVSSSSPKKITGLQLDRFFTP